MLTLEQMTCWSEIDVSVACTLSDRGKLDHISKECQEYSGKLREMEHDMQEKQEGQ